MDELNEAKKTYQNIEIPEELGDVVNMAIKKSQEKRNKVIKFRKAATSVAVASLVLVTVSLNTSEAFAMEVQKIPVIGQISKIFTIRDYEISDGDKHLTTKIPAVQDQSEFAVDVNKAIQLKVDEYIKESEARLAEYKEAFLATGGTEQEFTEKGIEVKVDYEIKSQSDDYLSFMVYGAENWVSAYSEIYFYNLDLKQNKYVTLEDMLGKDYIAIANDVISKGIDKNPDRYFEKGELGGFETITPETKFYINEKGNPVIVFDKYEIAPGSSGTPEFEIVK